MSALVVFGRKMIFIGHKLGQLVIIDLLCFWCCFFRFDLASLLYIWSLFRSVSEQAVSSAWIVSLEGSNHVVVLCSEQSTGESCLDNKGQWWAQVGDLVPRSGHCGLEKTVSSFSGFFSLTTLPLYPLKKLLFTLTWSLILFYLKKCMPVTKPAYFHFANVSVL